MRGDVDGDGKITENDRNRINEHLGGTITLTGADSWCAKVTGNNEISVSDLVQLMQYLEGKTNNLTGIPTFADYYNNWTYHKVDDLTGYWTAEIAINGLKTTSDAIVNIGNDEGIFYKSELSDGAIHFYATRPPIAEVSATITFKSGTGVITTSYESAKFHAATHSKDGADPITPESIGALSLSGGTMTGPLTLSGDPTGDLEATTKQYVDNHTSDTVLYTPQTLSAEQQAQARENINAAPGGFGLGSAYTNYIADFNACIKNGWYKAYSNSLNSPSIGGWDARYGALLVSTRDSVIYHVMGTFISDLVLQVLSFQAEQERTYIKQRQAEGIAAAKSNGVQFGRPRKPLPSNFEELYQRFRKNEPITRLAKECPEISESTLRLRLQERFDLDRKR